MIYVLSDDIETGKSNALLQWVEGRTDVHGVLSPRNSQMERYFLDVRTQESIAMQAAPEDDHIISVGRYHFLESSFDKANTIIEKATKNIGAGFVLIDELGKLELRSEGLHTSAKKAIDKAMHHKTLNVLLVIRTTLLNAILKKYDIDNPEFITVTQLSEGLI